MKTENNFPVPKPSRLNSLKIMLALAAGLMVPAAAGFAQAFYTNSTGDFNVPASWNPNGVPTGNSTDDNGSNNIVLIQPGDPLWQHGDTLAGNNDNTSGAYIQTGSTNNTGGGNWLRMGIGNNTFGSYILSNGVVNVGGRTQIGEHGIGYVEIDGGIYRGNVNDGGANPAMVCGQGDFGPGTGTLVINGGTVSYGRETWFGQAGGSIGTGYFFMNGGTLNVNDWFVFGRNGGGGGAQGYGVVTAGTINFTGGGQFLIGGGGVGSLTQSGGTINAFNQYLIPQSDGGGGGTGTNNLSGNAIVNLHSWIAVGRNGGYGELNISGNAAINRNNSSDGGSHFDIGGGGKGVINQTGGTITESSSDLWIGENNSATWNFNGGSAFLKNVVMCVQNSASGKLNLNSGLFQVTSITSSTGGSAVSTLNLNGATLQANANSAAFIGGLYEAFVGAAGITIDSQGFNINISQALLDNGGGTLAKTGTGTLTLSGANSYTGTTAVNQGTLATTTASTGAGIYTVANGAALNVQVVGSLNSQLTIPSLTFSSTATALGVDMNNFGNPASAPVNVGALTVNGTLTINVLDALPQVGQFPLVAYGSKTGSSYVLGSLPVGVTAHLVDNTANNSIDLAITVVNLPRWEGNAGGNWDIGLTTNWINIGTGLPTFYLQGNAVAFDDNATGTTTVNLVAAVTPALVNINNNNLTYTLRGTGSINGTVGISKQGTGTFAINNVNGYTGPTTIAAGTLSVTNLANGGSASAIGASSANPTNLVLSGGTLAYAGAAVTINRGYSLPSTNQSSFTIVSNLTLSGLVTASSTGAFEKDGDAKLTYKTVGNNQLSGGSYNVRGGSVVFDGSAGIQSNTIPGVLSVGGTANASAVLTNTTVSTGSDTGVTLANTIGSLEVDNGATLNVGSWLLLGDAANAVANLTMSGGTINVPNGRFFLCSAPGTMATFTMTGGTINKTGGDYYAIVNGGWNGVGARTGVVNQVNGTINCQSECWVGDGGGAGNGSLGIYNLSGGTLTLGSWFGVGRDGTTGIFNMTGGTLNKAGGGDMVIGRGGSAGTFTLSAGTINKDAGNPIIIGQGSGTGEFDQTGGTLNSAAEYWVGVDNGTFSVANISGTAALNFGNWVSLGRSGNATINFSGGSITKTNNGQFIVGDGGTSVFNQSGSTVLNDQNELWIGQAGSGDGTINLTNGTISVGSWLAVGRESGQGVLNIYGGSLTKAGGGNMSIAHNDNAHGTINMYGGAFTNNTSETWVGENGGNTAKGTWNMFGGTAVLGVVHLANAGDVQGQMTLNGGSLTANEISTGNNGAPQRELDFNGGVLVAGADNANFIHDLSAANVQSGGAIINTAGHSVSVNQALLGTGGDAGLTKNGNGTLYLNGLNTYTNLTQVNAGGLGGAGTILGPVTVSSVARLAPGTAAIGTLTISNVLTLAAGSTTAVKASLDSGATNDMVVGLSSVTYAGSLVVSNAGAGPLVTGSQFHLFSAAASGGNFTSVTILPAGAGTFNPTTGVLTITSGSGGVTFNPVKRSGNNLIFTGTGGPANGGYTLLTTTNLATAPSSWATNTTGTFDGFGVFSNAISINPAQPAQFFKVRVP